MKAVFQEHFQEHGGFLKILKQVFRVHFPEFSLLTYFLLTMNYWLTSVTFNTDFWKMSKVLCSRFFCIFQNIPLKYSRLYTRLQFIVKRLYEKVIQENFFWRKGYLLDSCNKSIWAWKCTIKKIVRILNKWQKTEKLLFSIR